MSRVSDVMSRDVFWLDDNAPLSSASWEMNAEFVSGAPVRDSQGKLAGVVSKTDLLDGAHEPATMRVRDVMTEDVAKVTEDASLGEAVHVMLSRRIHRVLVVDASGDVVGVVTPLDALDHAARQGAFD